MMTRTTRDWCAFANDWCVSCSDVTIAVAIDMITMRDDGLKKRCRAFGGRCVILAAAAVRNSRAGVAGEMAAVQLEIGIHRVVTFPSSVTMIRAIVVDGLIVHATGGVCCVGLGATMAVQSDGAYLCALCDWRTITRCWVVIGVRRLNRTVRGSCN